ncbi:protein kinase [Brevibacterium sp. ZH18]|uniref:protein kinase n=1 Tax=Brevibacterium sp. ZH18 TaxID=2927784 RepID=UPI001F60B1E7|nr:protein kinase [Brevibacterium sp. ZH18]MCI4012300.1 protein kinase [Brevibacterium sp. ZH18]
MSDVPPRPRIRPATSDDWQTEQPDRAVSSPSQGQGSGSSAADFDNSTYYEYLERHTGDQPASKARTGNVFAPAGDSPFQDHVQTSAGSQPSPGQRTAARASGRPHGIAPYSSYNSVGHGGPGTGPITPLNQPTPPPKKSNGATITIVIVAILIILALLAFFGIRSLAPSPGAVPVNVGGDGSESAPASPSPSDTLVQPTSSPEDTLASFTETGTAKAADLEGQWVTQVSAKKVGLEADGKSWTAQDVLNEFEANRVKYPGAILIHSGDWGSYKDGDYWVTIISTPYSDPEAALDQCRSWGLDRDHCLAKRLVKDGSPTDNSAYLDK